MGSGPLSCERLERIMSQITTDNFWQVMQSFSWPDPEPVQYRLYHDDQGRPLFYTMEHLPGTYIEVDQATYLRSSYHVRVRHNKLIFFEPKALVSRLLPNPDSGTPCHCKDVCVVTDSDRPHQKWKKQSNDSH